MIEELQKEGEAREQEADRPRLELPLPPPGWEPQKNEEEKVERGVVVIDFSV